MSDAEMTFAGQLIDEINDTRLMTFDEMALHTGVHANTIRDYARGNIKHFGRETAFWNAILRRLYSRFGTQLPPVAYRIGALMFNGSPICMALVPDTRPCDAGFASVLASFTVVLEDAVGALKHCQQIYADGRVDRGDDPNISELEAKLDSVIGWAFGIKARVARDRATNGVSQ